MPTPLVLQSPTQDGAVGRPFSADSGLIELVAPRGAPVVASVSGTVSAYTGSSVQITTLHEGQAYVILYGKLQKVAVRAGQVVQAGDRIAESAGPAITFALHQVLDPALHLAHPAIRLQPVDDRVRVRDRPVDGDTRAFINREDVVESLESDADTERKLGVEGEWLHVRTAQGVTGYVAAWFLQRAAPVVTIPVIGPAVTSASSIVGVNLDIDHPLGHPDPARLRGLGWVRLLYNVSFDPVTNTFGNTDVNAANARYRPWIEAYARAGLRVLLVFTHQTYGEGAGFQWPSMTSERWRDLTARFTEIIRQIAGHYAGQNLVHAYQIWNEQDAPIGAPASVSMSPADYAHLLAESILAIRQVDRAAQIITGGHTSGPGSGGAYARATLAAMPADIRPDGIAFHPYGRGPQPNDRYTPFGHLQDEFDAYGPILPDRPLWITEWGVLDFNADPPEDVLSYATSFVQYLRTKQAGRVGAAIWYAWAESMHNGYGLVGRDDQPRQPLFSSFLAL